MRKPGHRGKLVLVALPLALWTPTKLYAQASPEASHQERFETPAKALERAESDLTAKLAANPTDASALSSRGLIRLQLNNGSGALADLRAAVSVAPDNPQFHIDLAYSLLVQQKLPEGIAEAREALALEEKNYAAHGILGRALLA